MLLSHLELVPARETLQAARLQCLLSRAEFQAACHDAGMAAHLASEELVGTPGLDDSQERVELWLYLQMTDALIIYTPRGEFERTAAVIENPPTR